MTLLMVTHEIGFARRAADRVVVLAEGKLLEDGPPEEVIGGPQHERVKLFLRRVLG
jgi:polar amino acid transport system ATP-binding protein